MFSVVFFVCLQDVVAVNRITPQINTWKSFFLIGKDVELF